MNNRNACIDYKGFKLKRFYKFKILIDKIKNVRPNLNRI